MNDLIEKLSNLRSQFNCFDENERDAYHTLSEAIKALSERPEPCDDPRADIYYLAEKIGIHRLYELVVELRGEPEPCEDAVPRTSVEYICRKNTVSTNPYKHEHHDKFIEFMDDPEISDFGMWQHSNGFNTALVAVKCDLDEVPSVTPKPRTGKWIINSDGYYPYCSECKAEPKSGEMTDFCPKCGAKMNGME